MPLDLICRNEDRGTGAGAWKRGMVTDIHEDISGFNSVVDPDSPFQVVRVTNWNNRAQAEHYLEENVEDGTGNYIGRRRILVDLDALLALPPPGEDKVKPVTQQTLQRDLTLDAVTGEQVDVSGGQGQGAKRVRVDFSGSVDLDITE